MKSLHVIDIGMRGHEISAIGERKIHRSDEIDQLLNGVFVSNIKQHPVVAGKDEIHAAPEATARLKIQFDDLGKKFSAFQHSGISLTDFVQRSGLQSLTQNNSSQGPVSTGRVRWEVISPEEF